MRVIRRALILACIALFVSTSAHAAVVRTAKTTLRFVRSEPLAPSAPVAPAQSAPAQSAPMQSELILASQSTEAATAPTPAQPRALRIESLRKARPLYSALRTRR